MSFRASVIASVLAATMMVSTVAQACLSAVVDDTDKAHAVRMLQADMNTSALFPVCNLREYYDAFAIRYRGDLKTHANVLKRHFEKIHGSKANKELNAYVTEVSNAAAIRHAVDANLFCSRAEKAYEALLFNGSADLTSVALAYSMNISPAMNEEIMVAATNNGCAVTTDGSSVVAGGEVILQ